MTSNVHDLGPVEGFEPGRPYRVQAGNRTLVLVRKNTFYVLRDTCPHQGAPLSGGHVTGVILPCKPNEPIVYDREGEILTCPWHGWEFDLCTGRSLFDPNGVRVRTYPTHIQNGHVFVQLQR